MNARKTIVAAVLAVLLAATGIARLAAQSAPARFYGPLSRVITPNGDRLNDLAIFCFENPQDSDISGKIYTLLGFEVAATGPKTERSLTAGTGCPVAVVRAQFVTWDGSANGARVRSGLYIYRMTSEEKTFSGTLLVVR